MDTDVRIPDRLICPITGCTFTPQSYRIQKTQGHAFLWVWCPRCDSSHRAAGDEAFDPSSPQVHCFELSAERMTGISERAVGGSASETETDTQ